METKKRSNCELQNHEIGPTNLELGEQNREYTHTKFATVAKNREIEIAAYETLRLQLKS